MMFHECNMNAFVDNGFFHPGDFNFFIYQKKCEHASIQENAIVSLIRLSYSNRIMVSWGSSMTSSHNPGVISVVHNPWLVAWLHTIVHES